MTTGHWNPGYGATVSRYQSATSGLLPRGASLPSGQQLKDMGMKGMDQHDLDEIRRNARDVWSRPDSNSTTYQQHFDDKMLTIDQITQSRPTSPSRRNKPHPPISFMTCRLHTVPGFFNPDATLGKEPYKLDRAVASPIRDARAALKGKYTARQSSAALNQYRHYEPDHDVVPVTSQHVTEKLCNEDISAEDIALLEDYIEQDFSLALQTHTPVASLHRYLRPAGLKERQNFHRIENSRKGISLSQPQSSNLEMMRTHDIEKRGNTRYVHRDKRGDFLMHPDWPPTLPHHRLNGLSTVDVPHTSGRR